MLNGGFIRVWGGFETSFGGSWSGLALSLEHEINPLPIEIKHKQKIYKYYVLDEFYEFLPSVINEIEEIKKIKIKNIDLVILRIFLQILLNEKIWINQRMIIFRDEDSEQIKRKLIYDFEQIIKEI